MFLIPEVTSVFLTHGDVLLTPDNLQKLVCIENLSELWTD